MTDLVVKPAFEKYMDAQFSPDPLWRNNVPMRQQLQMEDSFYAGAKALMRAFYTDDGVSLIMAEAELEDFGERIVQRYIDAGLLKP